MNTLSLKLKHWVDLTPSPRNGRAVLLRAAAGVRQHRQLEVAWFDASLLRYPENPFDTIFSWAVANGFQSRSAVCI
ncbi:MAG: hypothetical protein MUC85_05950 [Anaerolineales bacterium]|jgi:hypothetical protein|nr:hypothetical protein [Anaerolineales bacterium]